MKKVAIVYYSMSGNTKYLAEQISKKVDADLIEIVPVKEYPDSGFKKFFWGGKSAVMKETPILENYKFDESKYDLVIFGTPVWASTFVPPIRTFIKDNKEALKGKKIAVFVSYSGGGADKTIERLKEFLEIKDFAAELVLIDPKNNENDDTKKVIEEFCKKIIT